MAELALSEMTLLEGALAYANRHLKVLPLHGIDSAGDCTCGRVDCSSPGKHPRIKNGVKGASCEPEQVRTWWSSWPDSNIGLAVGSKAYKGAGLMVLDIDMPDGPESLATLADEGMTVPKTLVQRTGGGGLHYLFRVPDAEPVRNNVGLRKGIDVRADNGYIVVAPSRHLSGNQYSWSKDQQSIATVPPWLLQAVRNGDRRRNQAPHCPTRYPPEPAMQPWPAWQAQCGGGEPLSLSSGPPCWSRTKPAAAPRYLRPRLQLSLPASPDIRLVTALHRRSPEMSPCQLLCGQR